MIKLDSVSEQTGQGLKPCPFCGEKVYTQIVIVKNFHTEFFCKVRCGACGIELGKCANIECSFEDMLSAINSAIELWNRRADNG